MSETTDIQAYLAEIGRKGGKKSRRTLSSEEARNMVLVREARKAYAAFHSQCFWSNPPAYKPTLDDLSWLVEQLQKHGGRAGWETAQRLCR